jgi:hypothetical protein
MLSGESTFTASSTFGNFVAEDSIVKLITDDVLSIDGRRDGVARRSAPPKESFGECLIWEQVHTT